MTARKTPKKAKPRAAAPRATRTRPRKRSVQGDPGPMPPVSTDTLVVYIHGIGRHKPGPELKVDWDIALFGSDQGAATRMAYWSDIVHPPGRAGAAGKKATGTAGGGLVLDALNEAGVAPSGLYPLS